MSGRGGIEREAKREFERTVLAHIAALGPDGETVPAERVEQAIGYYRHCEANNPVQQVLGRRLRAAIVSLQAQSVLAPDARPDCFVLTPLGRDQQASRRQPWWQRLRGRAGPR